MCVCLMCGLFDNEIIFNVVFFLEAFTVYIQIFQDD